MLHPLPLLGIMKWDPRGSLQPDRGARDFLSRNNSSLGRNAVGYGKSWAKRSVSCCCLLKQALGKTNHIIAVMREGL